jgi:hypothetical protein
MCVILPNVTLLHVILDCDIMLNVISSFAVLFHYAEHLWYECHSTKCCSADCHSGVNFTNILLAAFAPKSFRQKITNPNCKHIKGAQKTFVQKICSLNIGEIDTW